jgi:FtsH-binding integral membrane protein
MWNSERAFFGAESERITTDVRDTRVSAFLGRVYVWMFLGLLVTAGTGLWVASSPGFRKVLFVQGLFWVLGFVQLGMVIFLRTSVAKMAPTTAAVLFMIYSALNGVTTSYIFLIYTAKSIVAAFAITAGMFAAMSVFGLLTTRSLAGLGQFLYMGLIGLIVASVVSIFVLSDALIFLISVVAVVVFTGLTAWHSQRLKEMAVALPDGRVGAYAVVGALSLYLDFINLFLSVVRLLQRFNR